MKKLRNFEDISPVELYLLFSEGLCSSIDVFPDPILNFTARNQVRMHSVRVGTFLFDYAQHCNLFSTKPSQMALVAIFFIGLYHDIGKFYKGLPEIWGSPKALGETGKAQIRIHSIEREAISWVLEEKMGIDSETLPLIIEIGAMFHHYTADGLGYPKTLPDKKILRISMPLLVMDCFEAGNSLYRDFREPKNFSDLQRDLDRAVLEGKVASGPVRRWTYFINNRRQPLGWTQMPWIYECMKEMKRINFEAVSLSALQDP